MDPITAGILVAASFASTVYTNRQESKINEAGIKLQTEQARLQTAEVAYERSKAFRKNISANLALAGAGFGGNTGFRGVATESISDYFADANALQTQDLFNQVSGQAAYAGNKASKFTKDVAAGANAVTLANQLGLFEPKKTKKKII